MNESSRTALVTGGSEGLGYHVARSLAERQYQVTIVSRNPEKLAAAVQQLPGSHHRCVALDLSTKTAVDELVRMIERESFNVLVNNAGATRFGALTTLDADMVERHLRLNFITPVLLSWAFLRAAKPGSVLVNVTSIVGTVPVPGNALYCSAKAGLQTLTECLWYETKRKWIGVIDFRPMSLKTGFHRAAGSQSMSLPVMTVAPHIAARDLVKAIKNRRGFVYSYGIYAILMEWMRRALPKKLLIQMLGRKSEKMHSLVVSL